MGKRGAEFGSPLAWMHDSRNRGSWGKRCGRGGLALGEVCLTLGEMEMGVQSAVLLSWEIAGARRAGGTWPHVPAVWVEV